MTSEKMKERSDKSETTAYHSKLEKWTSRELQLNVLHEEIINKREAMLGTSRNFFLGKDNVPPLINNTEAAIRNDKLMKDIKVLDDDIAQFLTRAQSPRTSNLETNYWSMVKNMFPIWQKSLEEVDNHKATS